MAPAYLTKPARQPAPQRRPGRQPKPTSPRRKPGRPQKPAPRRPPTPPARPAKPARKPLAPRPLSPGRVNPDPFTRPVPYRLHPLTKIARLGSRFVPILGWGLLGWEAYRWWAAQPGGAPAGWTECWNLGPPYTAVAVYTTPTGSSVCGTLPCSHHLHNPPIPGQIPNGGAYDPEAGVSVPAYTGPSCRAEHIYTGPMNEAGTRFVMNRKWSRVTGSHPPEVVKPSPAIPAPGIAPAPVPAWVPSYDPMQIPIGVPMPTPAPLPYRALPRHNRPGREPKPAPPVIPGTGPALDIEPGKAPRKSTHEYRPPRTDEREGKSNPKKGTAQYLQGAFHRVINGYTETDDTVNAVYQALPWNIRRWKGDDGIWRDRHWRTADRLKFLYSHMGKLNVTKALANIAKNWAIDAVGGAIGAAGRRAIQVNPHYRGALGLQSGGRFTKETWAEVYEQMKLGAAMQHKPRDYYRWQMVDDLGRVVHWDQLEPSETYVQTPYGARPSYYYDLAQLPPGFKWERNLVKGRKQMIPWLQSTYHKRIHNPRKGTVDWWRANNGKRIATEERRMYVHPA